MTVTELRRLRTEMELVVSGVCHYIKKLDHGTALEMAYSLDGMLKILFTLLDAEKKEVEK